MIKAMSFKLAFLGYVSSCLMNVAYANSSEGIVTLELVDGQEIRGVACNADPRYYTFKLTNGTKHTLTIKDIRVRDHSERGEVDFDHFVRDVAPEDYRYCGYDNNEISKHSSCLIKVKVDPDDLNCNEDTILPGEGLFEGKLEVKFYDTQYDKVYSHIDIPVTMVGSANDVSLLGQNLCGTEYSQPSECGLDSLATKAIDVTVDLDLVATTNSGFISSNIVTLDGAKYYGEDTIAKNAKADVKAAYNNIMDLAIVGFDANDSNAAPGFSKYCKLIPYNWFATPVDYDDEEAGNIPRSIEGGGLYCFTNKDGDSNPDCDDVKTVEIDTSINVQTTEPIAFVVDPTVCHNTLEENVPADFFAVSVGPNATFTIDTDIGDPVVSAEYLYFFVNGKVDLHEPEETAECDPMSEEECTYNLVGRFVLSDYFQVEGPTPSSILGSIYSTRASVGLVEGDTVHQPN